MGNNKLRVGNKVIILDSWGAPNKIIGKIGVIIKITDFGNIYRVEMVKKQYRNKVSMCWGFSRNCLEKLPSKNIQNLIKKYKGTK